MPASTVHDVARAYASASDTRWESCGDGISGQAPHAVGEYIGRSAARLNAASVAEDRRRRQVARCTAPGLKAAAQRADLMGTS